MFNQQELQILLGGVNAPVDLDDLRKHTNYGGLYNNEEPTIQTFWRVRHGMGRHKTFLYLSWNVDKNNILPLFRFWRALIKKRDGRFCALSRAAVDHRCCERYLWLWGHCRQVVD